MMGILEASLIYLRVGLKGQTQLKVTGVLSLKRQKITTGEVIQKDHKTGNHITSIHLKRGQLTSSLLTRLI